MSSFLLLLCGLLGGGVVYGLWVKGSKWYHWVLAIGLYFWICAGISFVYINSVGYHHQAATVGMVFFGLIALIWAFIVARIMGFLGKEKQGKMEEQRDAT